MAPEPDAETDRQVRSDVDQDSVCRGQLKCDGTRAETTFGLSAKRTSPFKFFNWPGGGGSVQSTTGSRGVRISGSNGSNAGYTMFWGRVQDYWLPTPFACFPFTSPTVRHRVPSHFKWTLPLATCITVPSSLISSGHQLNCLLAFWHQ